MYMKLCIPIVIHSSIRPMMQRRGSTASPLYDGHSLGHAICVLLCLAMFVLSLYQTNIGFT